MSVITGLAIVWKILRHPRAADRPEGRPGHDLVRAAARLVLLLPLLPAPDLQVAGHGDPRHVGIPTILPCPAARAAVHRPAHGAAALAPPGRDRRRGADDPLDGRPHLQGRGREGADRERGRGGDPGLGAEAGLRRTTRRRSRARTCSPSRAARTATPTSAPAARTSARRTSRAEGAKGKGVQFQIDHLKCPSCVNPGSPMPPFAALGEDNLHKLAVFLEASKGPQ